MTHPPISWTYDAPGSPCIQSCLPNAGLLRSMLLLALSALLCSGCATIESRIKKNQAAFDTYAPDVQALIREGKVQIGFTPDMAGIALGEPKRKYTRTTANGVTEIWAYVYRKRQSETVPVRGSFTYRDSNGRTRRAYGTDYVTVDSYVEYDRLRLEFIEGRLIAFEEVTE